MSQLGDGCILDSECEGALICVHRVCHDICGENRDCPDGQRCVRGGPAGNVCQQAGMLLCVRDSDCPDGQTCAVDGECRDACREDVDCVVGHICVNGSCATEDELVDGQLPPNGTLSEGTPCTLNSQCPTDQKCIEGKCLFECINNLDCPSQQCIDNYCYPDQPDCTPGAQQACMCGTAPGAQRCSDDGNWLSCKCGGMSSVSGMGGMSTVSGMGGLGMGGVMMPVTSSGTGGNGGMTTTVTSSTSSTGGGGSMTTTTVTSSSSSTGGGGMATTTSTSTSASSTGGGGMATTTTTTTSVSGSGGLGQAGAMTP